MDGVLVVDKPAGPTSHDMVLRVRRVLGVPRAGHTGTLDPFATGVLPVCLGKATRLARFLAGGEKVYQAEVRLGFATTTDDLTGESLGEPRPLTSSRETVEAAVADLVGSFDQVPPAFSARRVGGRRLYELARRGEAAARAATPVTVHSLVLSRFDGERLELEVRCSPGTYVRALARDLGEQLGTGAHLTSLRRLRSGAFDLSCAVSGDDLAGAAERLIRLSSLLGELPAVHVGDEGRRFVRHGRDLGPDVVLEGFPRGSVDRLRVVDASGTLIALAVPVGGASRGAPGLVTVPALHPDVVLLD
jgi:tRNA pseudouridine55 synthase